MDELLKFTQWEGWNYLIFCNSGLFSFSRIHTDYFWYMMWLIKPLSQNNFFPCDLYEKSFSFETFFEKDGVGMQMKW